MKQKIEELIEKVNKLDKLIQEYDDYNGMRGAIKLIKSDLESLNDSVVVFRQEDPLDITN